MPIKSVFGKSVPLRNVQYFLEVINGVSGNNRIRKFVPVAYDPIAEIILCNVKLKLRSGCLYAPIENVTSYTSPFISGCCSSFSHIWTQINTHKWNTWFLDEVQGRLIKAWFGVSKYCSTSSLRTAIGWRKASEFHLSTSAEPKCILDPLLPIPLHLPAHSRRNMGLWYSNGLHHLWC